MVKLIMLVIVETVLGVAAAAVILVVLIPVLIGHRFITPGDLTGSIVIGAVLLVAVGAMLFRPGSALHRIEDELEQVLPQLRR